MPVGQYTQPGGTYTPYGWSGGNSPFGSGYSPGRISGYASSGNTDAASLGVGDYEIGRYNALYNYENPSASFDNVLRDSGYNPNIANPFVQSLRSMAPGLANSYLIDRAMLPGQGATTGLDYRNYMQGILNPNSQPDTSVTPMQEVNAPGGVVNNPWNQRGSEFYAALGNSAQRMQQAVQAVRGYDPQTTSQVNPFLGALQDRMATGGGQGGLDMLMSFYGPQMPRGMRTAYGNSLDTALANATRNFWNQPNASNAMGSDIYSFLFGV